MMPRRPVLFLLALLVAAPAIAQHTAHAPTARPAEKQGGISKEFRQFAYFARTGEQMVFDLPATIRWEPRVRGDQPTNMRERTFAAGQQAVCNAQTFSAVGVGSGLEYVCTRLVETIVARELVPQNHGVPYVDERLAMTPRRGYAREILGPLPATSPHSYRPGPGGEFRVSCSTSHMGFDDPMLWPGREFWHHHTFFGNARVDRWTVEPRDYRESVCSGGNINSSGYWVPSVIDTRFGAPVVPAGVVVYYKGVPDAVPSAGMRFITGDPMRSTPRNPNVYPVSDWTCELAGGGQIKQGLWDEIPAKCPAGSRIVWVVTFPACWDGRDSSADHKSHMWASWSPLPSGAKMLPNNCPTSHPRRIFSISFNVAFLVRADDDVSRWRLSSDAYEWSKPAGYSAHADWWNGWDQVFLAAMKAACHDKSMNCGADNAPDGRRMNLN